MKTALMVCLLALSLTAGAAVQKKKVVKKTTTATTTSATTTAATPASGKKLSKDINFSGASVDGKYLSAGESIAEVEGDKDMGALIGIRKNFHDRLGDETARLQAASKSGKGN